MGSGSRAEQTFVADNSLALAQTMMAAGMQAEADMLTRGLVLREPVQSLGLNIWAGLDM